MAHSVANKIWGISIPEFLVVFGSEDHSRATLIYDIWLAEDFCSSGDNGGCSKSSSKGSLFQRNCCKEQVSPTAETIILAINLLLTICFRAMLMTTMAKNGISVVELQRRPVVKQKANLSITQTTMEVVAWREGEPHMSWNVERDDVVLYWARSGSNEGQGASGKMPVLALIIVSDSGSPQRLKMVSAKSFRKRQTTRKTWIWMTTGNEAMSDTLCNRNAICQIVICHEAVRTGYGIAVIQVVQCHWGGTALGNIMRGNTCTCCKLSWDKAVRLVSGCAWRFSQYCELSIMASIFVPTTVSAPHRPYRGGTSRSGGNEGSIWYSNYLKSRKVVIYILASVECGRVYPMHNFVVTWDCIGQTYCCRQEARYSQLNNFPDDGRQGRK